MKIERNPVQAGIVGLTVAVATVVATLSYDQLQFISGGLAYSAYFADAGGLMEGDVVSLAGVDVGKVSKIDLDDRKVLVTFTIQDGIVLGSETAAAIKTNTILGRKSLAVSPAGDGVLSVGDTIPLDRTNTPYSLNDALGDLTNTTAALDTDQVNDALNAVSGALTDTPPELRSALDGMTRLSQSINSRDETLRQLLSRAEGVSTILADRSGQINSLLVDGNQLLGELDLRRTAISELIANVSTVSRQLSGLVQDNQEQMQPTLERLNSVVANLQSYKENIGEALEGLAPYATSLGEAVGSGPFFMAYVYNFNVGKLTQGIVDSITWPEHLPDDLESLLNPPPSIEFKDPTP